MADPTVRSELVPYFRSQGLPDDGGVDAAWVRFALGPLPLAFPNIRARREAVRYHDVHHLVTGYGTDWRGEAQIGAWEVASGCGRYWVAWLLDSGALGLGAVLWPRATMAAFASGRRCRSLYGEPFGAVLDAPVPALRRRLGLDRPPPRPTVADRAMFLMWAAIGLGWMVALPAALVAAGVFWATGA